MSKFKVEKNADGVPVAILKRDDGKIIVLTEENLLLRIIQLDKWGFDFKQEFAAIAEMHRQALKSE